MSSKQAKAQQMGGVGNRRPNSTPANMEKPEKCSQPKVVKK